MNAFFSCSLNEINPILVCQHHITAGFPCTLNGQKISNWGEVGGSGQKITNLESSIELLHNLRAKKCCKHSLMNTENITKRFGRKEVQWHLLITQGSSMVIFFRLFVYFVHTIEKRNNQPKHLHQVTKIRRKTFIMKLKSIYNTVFLLIFLNLEYTYFIVCP